MRVARERISSSGCTKSGTMTVMKPPAAPARTPLKESSSTSTSCASHPKSSAARRNTSGSGLACSTSSPDTVAEKHAETPAFSRFCAIWLAGEEDATAAGMPCSPRYARSSSRPGFFSTPARRCSSTMHAKHPRAHPRRRSRRTTREQPSRTHLPRYRAPRPRARLIGEAQGIGRRL